MEENLLIHSMKEFRHVILACLELAEARRVVEIGSEYGGMTTSLMEWLQPRGGELWCIDPAPKQEFCDSLAGAPHVKHLAKMSLNGLAEVPCADGWLVDGDHNWYTVFHELDLIFKACERESKAPLIFLHDVGWPCGRRDFYYKPEQIPTEFRKSFTYDAGVRPGQTMLTPGRGFRGGANFAFADVEGGARNGVLTAVEDAIVKQSAAGKKLAWCVIPAVFGLGILFDATAKWAAEMAAKLLPWHEDQLIGTLERNRLANYLRVIEMQDTLLNQ